MTSKDDEQKALQEKVEKQLGVDLETVFIKPIAFYPSGAKPGGKPPPQSRLIAPYSTSVNLEVRLDKEHAGWQREIVKIEKVGDGWIAVVRLKINDKNFDAVGEDFSAMAAESRAFKRACRAAVGYDRGYWQAQPVWINWNKELDALFRSGKVLFRDIAEYIKVTALDKASVIRMLTESARTQLVESVDDTLMAQLKAITEDPFFVNEEGWDEITDVDVFTKLENIKSYSKKMLENPTEYKQSNIEYTVAQAEQMKQKLQGESNATAG